MTFQKCHKLHVQCTCLFRYHIYLTPFAGRATEEAPATTNKMLSFRPIPSPPPYSVLCSRPRRTLPSSIVPAPRRRRLPFAVAAAGQREIRRIDEDDYHSTVRSLNSRGRHKPRKSLGQVVVCSPKRKREGCTLRSSRD